MKRSIIATKPINAKEKVKISKSPPTLKATTAANNAKHKLENTTIVLFAKSNQILSRRF